MKPDDQATYDDVNLILKLYDMRREEKLREARHGSSANFKVKTLAELQKLCPPGRTERLLSHGETYWEMVGSFVAGGVLHPSCSTRADESCCSATNGCATCCPRSVRPTRTPTR